jgi:hypothetical protein
MTTCSSKSRRQLPTQRSATQRLAQQDSGRTKEWDVLIVGGEDHKTGQEDDPEKHFRALEEWTRERFREAEALEYRWPGQVLEPDDYLAFIACERTSRAKLSGVNSSYDSVSERIGGIGLNSVGYADPKCPCMTLGFEHTPTCMRPARLGASLGTALVGSKCAFLGGNAYPQSPPKSPETGQ